MLRGAGSSRSSTFVRPIWRTTNTRGEPGRTARDIACDSVARANGRRRGENELRWQAPLQFVQLFTQPLHLFFESIEAAGRLNCRSRRLDHLRPLPACKCDRSAEQMRVARIAAAGFTLQAHDEGTILAGPQAFERSFNLTDFGDRGHATCAGAQLPRGLRTTHEQLANDR